MLRLKLMFIPMVVLIFGAGMVVGRISSRVPTAEAKPPTTRPEGDRSPSWLHDQLGLNADQRKQMDAIWKEAMKGREERSERWRVLERERDNALLSLLTPEQKAQYDQIISNNRAKRTELDKEREKTIAQANEKSKALLTDEQKARWDELTKEMRDRRGPRGRGPGGDRGGDRGPGGPRPSTQPVEKQH